MKYAFSTVSCPQWDLQTIAAKAKGFGYDGVEVCCSINGRLPATAELFQNAPGKVKEIFAGCGVQAASLSSDAAYSGHRKQDAAQAGEVRRLVDAAQALECPFVRVPGMRLHGGQGPAEGAVAFGRWLLPLAEYAADRAVTLLVENSLSFRRARDLWLVLETVNHPGLSACWDMLSAAQVGEDPSLSVPVLNSRLQFVRVRDALAGQAGAAFCKLGEGVVPLEKGLKRLRGIGYGGWVCVDWPNSLHPELAQAEEVLPEAFTRLRVWTKGPGEDGKGKGVGAKAQAGAAG